MRLFTWIEAQTVLEGQYSRLLMSFYITAHALSGWKKDKQRLTKYWTFFTITYVWKILHCCSLFKLLYTSFENVVYFFVMQNFKFSNCSLQQWLQTLRLYINKMSRRRILLSSRSLRSRQGLAQLNKGTLKVCEATLRYMNAGNRPVTRAILWLTQTPWKNGDWGNVQGLILFLGI